MTAIWKSITDWFNSKGGWAHGMFAIYLMLCGAYDSVPSFAQAVNAGYAAMPSWAHQLVTVVIGFVVWYTQTNKVTPAQPGPPAGGAKLPLIILLCLLPLFAGMTACTNWERTTFQTLSATKADIDAAQAAYELSAATGKCPTPAAAACLPHTQAVFQAISTAKIADAAVVNNMVAYEQLKATGQPASTLQVAQNQVIAALGKLTPEIVALKALYAPQ